MKELEENKKALEEKERLLEEEKKRAEEKEYSLIQTIKYLKSIHTDMQTISQITGLPVDEIEKI